MILHFRFHALRLLWNSEQSYFFLILCTQITLKFWYPRSWKGSGSAFTKFWNYAYEVLFLYAPDANLFQYHHLCIIILEDAGNCFNFKICFNSAPFVLNNLEQKDFFCINRVWSFVLIETIFCFNQESLQWRRTPRIARNCFNTIRNLFENVLGQIALKQFLS